MVPGIFEAEREHLHRLDGKSGVLFFRDLLWAEARQAKISPSNITISERITVADGGVDARVDSGQQISPSGLIKPGGTCYQIKTGTTFKPTTESHIKEFLFGNKQCGVKENLGSEIRKSVEAGENLILVCFGCDPIEKEKTDAENLIRKYLTTCGFTSPNVEVWGTAQLLGAINLYPSLALKISGNDHVQFRSFSSWAKDKEMQAPFVASDKNLIEFIEACRKSLKDFSGPGHIRVLGEAGIGKTRCVFEVFSDVSLASTCLYLASPKDYFGSHLQNVILRADSDHIVTLVIDECDPAQMTSVLNSLHSSFPRIRLVTISNELDEQTGSTVYFSPPALSIESTSKIIQEYGVPPEEATEWAELCDGSPRVAHVIGNNLKNNTGEPLRPTDTSGLWERYIASRNSSDSGTAKARQVVLEHIALFKKFGLHEGYQIEAKAIAHLVQQVDPSITYLKFNSIVEELRNRKVIQGTYTRYITPKALHLWLWIRWWANYGQTFDFDAFKKDLPESLLNWFYEMFVYAAESETASRVVEKLLGPTGPLTNDKFLQSKLDSNFFLSLTRANPQAAMQCLSRTIGQWSKDKLVQFTGRRSVVFALEIIAFKRELFNDAARLLLRLGDAENESWANNASGVFTSLFSPGPGKVAPTEAAPLERFDVLHDALNSDTKEKRFLGFKALSAALESQYFSKTGGVPRAGLRRIGTPWVPKSHSEILDWYKKVWELGVETLRVFSEAEKSDLIRVLARRGGELVRFDALADQILDDFKNIARTSEDGLEQVLESIDTLLRFRKENISDLTAGKCQILQQELVGSGYSASLKRFVGARATDYFLEEDEKQMGLLGKLKELASSSIENPKAFADELQWLVTPKARNGHIFGYELGVLDTDLTLLDAILIAQKAADKNVTGYFFSGYLKALSERDLEAWEKILDRVAAGSELQKYLLELTWRSSITDRAALRILELAKQGTVEPHELRLFSMGGVIQQLSEETFEKWAQFLLNSKDSAAIFALIPLFYFYYVHKPKSGVKLPDYTVELLLHPNLLSENLKRQDLTMIDHEWGDIAFVSIEQFGEKSLDLLKGILKSWEHDDTLFDLHGGKARSVMHKLAELYPIASWALISKAIPTEYNGKLFRIKEWLRSGGFASLLSNKNSRNDFLSKLWTWVDENPEWRAVVLAEACPMDLTENSEDFSFVRELLKKYGDKKPVRSSLTANYFTGGWMGPESVYHQQRKEALERIKPIEGDSNVLKWINDQIASLNQQIQNAKIDEERRGY